MEHILQVEMKEIKEGTKINERFRSSESVERVILDEKSCQYLIFKLIINFILWIISNFEQMEIGKEIITDTINRDF